MATKIIHLNCQNCGAALDMDTDRLIAFCPYCGQKLLIDIDNLSEILLEKEKTKQKEIDRDLETKRFKHEEKRNNDKRESKFLFVSFGLIAFMLIVCLIGLGAFK